MSENLFFAVFPDADAGARIAEFSEQFRQARGLGVRVIPRQRLHATVAFMGGYPVLPDSLVQAAGRAGSLVRMAPFDVVFDRVDSFSGRAGHRPLILRADDGADGLRLLRDKLDHALLHAGLKAESASYEPHVTLSYADEPIEQAFLDTPFRWRVNQFALIRSLVGQSRYIPLERWRLDG